MEKSDTVQSVERAFLILDILVENGLGMGISDIAKKAGLKTSTAHRLLRTLLQLGVVDQDPESRYYNLSTKILLYSKAVLDQYDFVGSAHPILGELSKTVGETVFMGIHNNSELVYVDHVDTLDHVLRMTPQIGRRQPLHCTALGKVLLSHLPPDQLQNFFSRGDLPKLTENTITNPETLQSELEKIRLQGYSLDLEETEIGICCISAPVWGGDQQVVAAISVSGPATRMKMKGLTSFLKDNVISTAERISEIVIA
jgi:DNA-binding IclR family transcriptional regulator